MTNPERYCLACEKLGHLTTECHSTHGLNTPAARELFRLTQAANQACVSPEHHQPAAWLMELADRIDPDELWRRPGLEQLDMPPEQQDRLEAGVNLRRYADLLGQGHWRVFPPRRGICFRSSTLAGAVEMAQRDEERRAAS